MALRDVDTRRREIEGVVAPYGEDTYLTGDPGGERMIRGCFAKSIQQRGDKIPLLVGHDHTAPAVGMSRAWHDTDDGLIGTFTIKQGTKGDETLDDVGGGYLSALSVGFEPLTETRGRDGVLEVRDARLLEVSLVTVAAYDGAKVLAVRQAAQQQRRAEALAPFLDAPPVNLDPLDLSWLPSRNW